MLRSSNDGLTALTGTQPDSFVTPARSAMKPAFCGGTMFSTSALWTWPNSVVTSSASASTRVITRTFNDPLAAKVRSLLRREYNFSRTPGRTYSVPCVFSTEQLRYPKPDGGVCQSKSFVGEGVKLDCSGGFGSVTMVTATFGMVAASKAVERLLRNIG